MSFAGASPDVAAAYLDQAPDAMLAVDRTGVITRANSAAHQLFGYERLVGVSVDDLVPLEIANQHRAHRTRYDAAPRVRQMGEPGARLEARHADGSHIPVEIALSPIDVGGESSTMAVVRDVRDRLEAESEFESVRQSLDAVDEAVFMFDPETLHFEYVNAGAVAHTEYAKAELLDAMTPLHIKPEFTEASFRRLIQPLVDEHLHTSTFTTTHRTRTGRDIPVEISLSYPSTTAAVSRRLVALVRDITERKAAEDRLRASEQAFRSAFDDAAVPMTIVDLSDCADRRIVQANQALADMLGYSIDELVTMSMRDLTHPDDQEADVEGALSLSESAGTYQTEKRYRTSTGDYRWGALHASVLSSEDDRIWSLAHIVDITRQVEAEAERDRQTAQLTALAEIRKAALDERPTDEVLELVVSAAASAVDADGCLVLTTAPNASIIERATHGPFHPRPDADEALLTRDCSPSADAPVAELFHAASGDVCGPVMMVPLETADDTRGCCVVLRQAGSQPFGPSELAAVEVMVSEAEVTMVLAKARADRRRMLLIEDRERIARDLHDQVIQRLFAAGMGLQASLGNPERLRDRANEVVGELDQTIAVIRETIFQLTEATGSLQAEIERVVDRHRDAADNDISLELQGNIDEIGSDLRAQVLPALNELLSNVARHAEATHASVEIDFDGHHLVLTVSDDGVGMDNSSEGGSGLRNLHQRATAFGGDFLVEPRPASGTKATWTALANPA